MRYIGCKRRLLPFIHQAINTHKIEGDTFCDLFAGTATVGNYFKQQGYRIIANDLLYCSYVQQQVKIAINRMPSFEKLRIHLSLKKQSNQHNVQCIMDYLNQQKGIEGFIYRNYSPGGTVDKPIKRMYFTNENAKKIDRIREIISVWKQLDLINEEEFHILLYALLEEVSKRANTTGTQSSFLKHFHRSALQPIVLVPPFIAPTHASHLHQVYCADSVELITQLKDIDILYLDPPYTRKQYVSAYHLLETVAKWDYPLIQGISGVRKTRVGLSTFSRKQQAFQSLHSVISQRNYRHLLLSYSDDSLISHENVLALLKQVGEVEVHTDYLRRYNSLSLTDKRCSPQKYVTERLYYVKPYLAVPAYSMLNQGQWQQAPYLSQWSMF